MNDVAHKRHANEHADLISSQKTTHEKFGHEYWRLSLRLNHTERIVNYTPMKTSGATNIYISMNQSPNDEIEIIKNPQRRGGTIPRKRGFIEQKVQSVLSSSAKKKRKGIFVPDDVAF